MNWNINDVEDVFGDDIDTITNLYGNHTYRNEIMQMIDQNITFSIMIFGIDDFKHINNLHSYSFGNRVLKFFADKINMSIINPNIKLFKVTGDGFGLICTDTQKDILENQYEKILSIAQTSKKSKGLEISFTISAGISTYPKDGNTCDEIYQNSMIALETAKAKNKKNCIHYSSELSTKNNMEMLLFDKLKLSVKNNFEGFSLVYQPIVRCDTKEIDGCEALLRWTDPSFTTNISPDAFIPALIKCRLLFDVGAWVIEKAFEQCAKWNKIMPNLKMNVNVSALQFQDSSFSKIVLDAISKNNLNPKSIVLELTESEYLDYTSIGKAFNFFRKYGIMMALDDFGTGYASVDILRSISADELKIDRSFIKEITYNRTDQIILKGIIDICRTLDIIVCVEGIENKETEAIISQMNPQLFQGYLYSKPITANELENKYLTSNIRAIPEAVLDNNIRPVRAVKPSEIIDVMSAAFMQVQMDEKFSMIGYNEAFRRMTGFSINEIEEIFKSGGLAFVHPDDTDYVISELQLQLSLFGVATADFRIITKDGSYIWVLATGTVYIGSNGIQSLAVTVTNINDMKISDIKKLEELKKYEYILSNAPVGIQCLSNDAEYTIEYMSSAVREILGYTKDEILEKFDNKYIRIVFEEDRARIVKEIQEKLKHSDLVHLRYRVCCKDGSIIWVKTINRYCKADDKGVRRWSCNVLPDDKTKVLY